jgi:hypothetical protein
MYACAGAVAVIARASSAPAPTIIFDFMVVLVLLNPMKTRINLGL